MSDLLSSKMLLSGRVKKTPPGSVSGDRYNWISLQDTEPDLGLPPINGSLLFSSEFGQRQWSTTLSIDSQGHLRLSDELKIGNVSSDNYSRLRHVSGSNSGYGFSGVDATYTVLVNEEATVAQALFLGDADYLDDGTLFGISLLRTSGTTPSSGEENWIPRLTLSGAGKLSITGILDVGSGNITTSAAVADIFNTPATVNIAGGGSEINIGSPTGVTNVKNKLSVANTIEIGNSLQDQYTRLLHVEGKNSGYGFGGVNATYTAIVNEESTVAQAMFLGDVDTTSDGTLFGISILAGSSQNPSTGEENWIPRLTLSGAGKFTVAGPLVVNNGIIESLVTTTTSVFGNAEIVNLGTSANTINIGSDVGLTAINTDLVVRGSITADSINLLGVTESSVTFTKSLILTTEWQDTGISSTDLSTGTYILQLYANDVSAGGTNNNEYYSGIMSWYSGDTNSSLELPVDEIVLHRAGASSDAGIYLRTYRSPSNEPTKLKLQIYSNVANPNSSNYVFRFRRFI